MSCAIIEKPRSAILIRRIDASIRPTRDLKSVSVHGKVASVDRDKTSPRIYLDVCELNGGTSRDFCKESTMRFSRIRERCFCNECRTRRCNADARRFNPTRRDTEGRGGRRREKKECSSPTRFRKLYCLRNEGATGPCATNTNAEPAGSASLRRA